MSRTTQRPVTWGGSQLGPSFASPPGLDSTTDSSDADLPELYRQAWEQVAFDSSSDAYTGFPTHSRTETAITLAALHKSLYTAGGQTAGTAEKIVNLACKGARCSRLEFYTALGLLKQAQDGHYLDLTSAQHRLATGDVQTPFWDFSKSVNNPSLGHTFPPQSSRMAEHTAHTAHTAAPLREMSDPWNTSNISTGPYGGLPYDPAYGSTYRSIATKTSHKDDANGIPGHSESNKLQHGGDAEVGSPSGPPGLSRFRSMENSMTQERPFSYMSDTAEVNAVNAAEDPAAELPEDEVTVRLRSELEGFIMKHNVYLVSSSIRKSQVTRRYSDWVWLAECLVKRYPFRCLPVLPPKRLSMPIPGRHLSSDDLFIERRRRSLERYLKMLSLHPVLREDKLVTVFFTEKQVLSEWRNTAPPLYLDEEGITKIVDEGERMRIPEDLDHKLTQQRNAIPDLVDRWTSMVALIERIVKRRDADAADYSRLNFSLLSVIETSSKRWRPESDHRKTTEEIMTATANIFQDHSDMTSSRVAAISLSTLEGIKAQRDLLLSFRDLIVRLDRLLPDPIDSLKKRIEANQRRLTSLAATPSPTPGSQQEQATLTTSVKQDTQSIQKYLNRRTHTKKTLWEELIWFHYRFKAVEEDLQKLVRDETYFLSMLTRIWETTEMKMKMIR